MFIPPRWLKPSLVRENQLADMSYLVLELLINHFRAKCVRSLFPNSLLVLQKKV